MQNQISYVKWILSILVITVVVIGLIWSGFEIISFNRPDKSNLGRNSAKIVSKKEKADHQCTLESKVCADGSSVGRTGDNCEFSPCPEDKNTAEAKTNTGLANPASTNCINKGGKSEIRTNADGSQTGYCLFENGQECEEWSFFRNECQATNSNTESYLFNSQDSENYQPGAAYFTLKIPREYQIELMMGSFYRITDSQGYKMWISRCQISEEPDACLDKLKFKKFKENLKGLSFRLNDKNKLNLKYRYYQYTLDTDNDFSCESDCFYNSNSRYWGTIVSPTDKDGYEFEAEPSFDKNIFNQIIQGFVFHAE